MTRSVTDAGREGWDAGREGWVLPFCATLGAGLGGVALAAAIGGLDWRWLLLALSATSVVLPCGVLALRGRLDIFEPLIWFALLFLLLFVFRPAWDLGHENFVYTSRLIYPTFTEMIVAGLLAGTGFVIGYLTPPASVLSARLPSPPSLDPRRLMVWATVVLVIALIAFLIFFVDARGWRDPADFFFRGESRLTHLLASPAATSKYFLASILLMVPVALFYWWIRESIGTRERIGRIAGWAALASILAFLVYNFSAGQRRYVVVMVGALAVYYYLRRSRRPKVLTLCVTALVALTVASVVRDLRLAHAQPTNASPVQWLPWNAVDELFETQDTGVAPALATEMLVVPEELGHTYGKTTLLGPFITLVPRQFWHGKPLPADQEVLAKVWGGTPCGYQGQCSTFSPFGEPFRDGGLVGVFLFAVAFGAFWKVAWLYYLRHRESAVALIAYAALLPFMISWMRANFTLQALQASMVLAVVILGAVLCRTRPAATAPAPRATVPFGGP